VTKILVLTAQDFDSVDRWTPKQVQWLTLGGYTATNFAETGARVVADVVGSFDVVVINCPVDFASNCLLLVEQANRAKTLVLYEDRNYYEEVRRLWLEGFGDVILFPYSAPLEKQTLQLTSAVSAFLERLHRE